MSSYFPHQWFQGNSMHIDRRQSTELCPYHMGWDMQEEGERFGLRLGLWLVLVRVTIKAWD